MRCRVIEFGPLLLRKRLVPLVDGDKEKVVGEVVVERMRVDYNRLVTFEGEVMVGSSVIGGFSGRGGKRPMLFEYDENIGFLCSSGSLVSVLWDGDPSDIYAVVISSELLKRKNHRLAEMVVEASVSDGCEYVEAVPIYVKVESSRSSFVRIKKVKYRRVRGRIVGMRTGEEVLVTSPPVQLSQLVEVLK